jgi:hypothetical protein
LANSAGLHFNWLFEKAAAPSVARRFAAGGTAHNKAVCASLPVGDSGYATALVSLRSILMPSFPLPFAFRQAL